MSTGPVRAEDVRGMLGLADRTRVIDLFEALMRADMPRALGELRDQYDTGADPAMILGDLAEFTHFVTRLKIVPALADDVSLTEAERTRGRDFASKLSMRVLARTWQMLLKGIAEVEAAGRPLAAAEMVLVRIAYAADLPTPDEVIRSLGDVGRGDVGRGDVGRGNGTGVAASLPPRAGEASEGTTARAEMPSRGPMPQRSETQGGPRSAPRAALATAAPAAMSEPRAAEDNVPVRAVASFEDLVALAAEKRDLTLKSALERDVRLVRFEDGKLEMALEPGATQALAGELSKKLNAWTGRRWMVVISAEPGAPTLRALAEARNAALKDGVRADPLVQAVLAKFPGAEIVAVRPPPGAAATSAGELPPTASVDGEIEDSNDDR
jgi:DNA polymerase-3 subunit gamma/tau